jgi:hypothetical protein
MTSSIIKDLEFFIDDEISFPVSMVILKRLHFSKYDSSHLVPQAYDFGHFSWWSPGGLSFQYLSLLLYLLQ